MDNPRRQRRWGRIFFVFVGIPALIAGGVYLWNLPYFEVQSIPIKGVFYSNPKVIKRLCEEQIHHNILRVRWGGWSHKIEKKIPQAERLKLRMKWPNRIDATLIEKPPYLSVIMPNRRWVMAKDGTPLHIQTLNAASTWNFQASPKGFCIYGLSPKWMVPKINPILLGKFQSIYDQIQAYPELLPMGIYVQKMKIAPSIAGDRVVLLKDHQLPIKMGDLETLPSQLHALHVFWRMHQEKEPTRSIQYIELRVPDRIIVKYGQR